jgi:hypothetical protein
MQTYLRFRLLTGVMVRGRTLGAARSGPQGAALGVTCSVPRRAHQRAEQATVLAGPRVGRRTAGASQHPHRACSWQVLMPIVWRRLPSAGSHQTG